MDLPDRLPFCAQDFGLYHLAPLWPLPAGDGAEAATAGPKLALLGEVGKWVPIAAARISHVTSTSSGLEVGLMGEAGETVELAFATVGAAEAEVEGATVVSAVCKVGAAGTATARFSAAGKATCA